MDGAAGAITLQVCQLERLHHDPLPGECRVAVKQDGKLKIDRFLAMPAVDLLLIPGPNPNVPMAESIGALNKAKRDGLTRHIGVANYTVALLDEAPAAALRIFAGKHAGAHCLPQARINAILIEHAREGGIVVRLKGGDPFVFDRGGSEALFLHEQGVRFEVVPGVPAGIAVPSYAGVPTTSPVRVMRTSVFAATPKSTSLGRQSSSIESESPLQRKMLPGLMSR